MAYAPAGHSESVLNVAFSPDGRRLASGSGDTTLRFWDLNTQLPQAECKVRDVHAAALPVPYHAMRCHATGRLRVAALCGTACSRGNPPRRRSRGMRKAAESLA